MKTKIKQNKVLFVLIILSLITLLSGILLPTTLKKEDKKEIEKNITTLEKQIKEKKITSKKNITHTIENNLINTTTIWVLGISIIGIPIILIIYLGNLLVFSLELIFLILKKKTLSIVLIPIYLLPSLLKLIIYFLLSFYAIHYSCILIKLLFFKKEYPIKKITRNYFKIFIISLVGMTMISLIELFLIPKLLLLFL